jgi:hypothetical protein
MEGQTLTAARPPARLRHSSADDPRPAIARPPPDFTKVRFEPRHEVKVTVPQPFAGLEANDKV